MASGRYITGQKRLCEDLIDKNFPFDPKTLIKYRIEQEKEKNKITYQNEPPIIECIGNSTTNHATMLLVYHVANILIEIKVVFVNTAITRQVL